MHIYSVVCNNLYCNLLLSTACKLLHQKKKKKNRKKTIIQSLMLGARIGSIPSVALNLVLSMSITP